MSEPTTEAGRRLRDSICSMDHTLTILAIEQEARADLAARIVAAVEGLPTKPNGYWVEAMSETVSRTAVLDAIREAAK